MRLFKQFLVVFICAIASGCVTPAVYGESWVKQVIVESGACPVIDGEYQNTGEQFSKAKHGTYERHTVSLVQLLTGILFAEWLADDRLGKTFDDSANDTYQTIRLRLAEGMLHIEASLADGSTRAFDRPTSQQCRDSTLLLMVDWNSDEISVVRNTLALGRAEDGSLLVRESESEMVFLLVPIFAGTSADWIRFLPVAPLPADAESPPPDAPRMDMPASEPAPN